MRLPVCMLECRSTGNDDRDAISQAMRRISASGWKPTSVLQQLFALPALQQFLPHGLDKTQFNDETLRQVTRSILESSDETISSTQLELQSASLPESLKYIQDLLPRLQSQYSEQDPGNLVALICMNYLILKPGEAVFIPADGIHAYLYGDAMR